MKNTLIYIGLPTSSMTPYKGYEAVETAEFDQNYTVIVDNDGDQVWVSDRDLRTREEVLN